VGAGSKFHFSIPVFDPERAAARPTITAGAASRTLRGGGSLGA
jgi:hypothetical protein